MSDELHAYFEQLQAELDDLKRHREAKADLLSRFEEAERTLPAGYAVVLAAGDCGRAGSKHPIPAENLIGLARGYCARLWPGEPISDDDLRAGIDWAASCEEGHLPLLIPRGDDAYRASPAISGRVGRGVPPIPPETWDWLFTHLTPLHLLELGDAIGLDLPEQRKQMAERAWTHAFEAGEEPVRSAASVALGLLYAEREDDADAIVALERADISLLAPSGQARAAYTLGLLYDRGKDAERARRYYEQAIEADDWEASPNAAYNLGLLLGDLGDADGAEAAFAHAIEAKYYPDKDRAVHALAITLQKLGEIDRAKAYYERAIATDGLIGNTPSRAALDLGCLHEDEGDDDQAMAAYERALDGSDATIIAEAIWRYARLAAPKEQADLIAICQRLLGRVRDSMEPAAACRLGQWLWCLKKYAATAAMFERAMAFEGHAATEAAFLRGWIAHTHDDDAVTAQACYQRAIDDCHPDHSAQAANNLGVLHAQRGEYDRAITLLQSVQDYPRGTATAKAALNTGLLLERIGLTDEARAAFEQAIDPDHPAPIPRAVAHLARLLRQANELEAAEALSDKWRNADDPELAEAVTAAFAVLKSHPNCPVRLLTEPW